MNILSPQTGNPKGDEALRRLIEYVDMFDDFTSFYNYFMKQLKTDDMNKLNKYLLMGFFSYLKQPRHKHKFDEIVELLQNKEPDKAKNLITWLDNTLFEVKAKYGGEK